MEIQKIFLVDDDPDIRVMAELSLSAVGGWEVAVAESGFDALIQIPEFHPDVILLDVMMPEMDGLATFGRIRELERYANVPIIFVTAKAQKHELGTYRGMGASGCIWKPFDPMTLPRKIAEMVKDI